MSRPWRVGWWQTDANAKVINRGVSGELTKEEAEVVVRSLRTDKDRHAIAMEERQDEDKRRK